ncbi:peptidoglycan-binding protein [Candidatus Venteria ishoeyi]|uniref:peptidoglycan-binding protein n=1 Tax=Candidatus Venteria ishoeyi TaxID=1899563 RepID=UPI0025A52A47|nr:peptidoglycan-binding protein [Candidatus Venteria ishoeyi]MDM8545885.1 peptidoglycan-binding protein [Candidatus Venteria ishoeyi]
MSAASTSSFKNSIYLVFSLIFILISPVVSAYIVTIDENTVLKPNYPETYVVKKNDTVLDIVDVFVDKPWLMENAWLPDTPSLYPGDEISLVQHAGKPAFQIKRNRVVKLRPGVIPTRTTRAIPKIPLGSIQQFLFRPVVVEADELETAPYVIANANEQLLMSTGDQVYIRNLEEEQKGQAYLIVRRGQEYRDPVTDDVLAYEAVYLGEGRLTKPGVIATLNITSAKQDIRQGDRLLSLPEREFEEDFIPSAPDYIEDARIIAVVNGMTQIGQYQVVVLNKGQRDNMQRGDLLAVYRGGDQIKDPVTGDELILPSIKAGRILLFKVFESVSFALVQKITRTIYVGDEVNLP